MTAVVGYVRVSTDEQAVSGLGLEAQKAAIRTAASLQGWTVGWCEDRGVSAKSLVRPGLQEALELVRSGVPEVLVVAKLDRLSRSVADFAGLVERSRREGWGLVCLDVGVDTSTPSGEMVANVLAVFAQFERRLIGERTRRALQVARERGVRLGRPSSVPDGVVEQVRVWREDGMSFRRIAAELDAGGVPTAGGGLWQPSSVHALLRRQEP